MVLNFLNYCTFTILFCLLLFWLQVVLPNLLNHFIWLTTFSWRWFIIFATVCTDVLYQFTHIAVIRHLNVIIGLLWFARRHLQADAPEAEDDGARGDPEREPETSAGATVASGAVQYRAPAGLFVLSALTRRRAPRPLNRVQPIQFISNAPMTRGPRRLHVSVYSSRIRKGPLIPRASAPRRSSPLSSYSALSRIRPRHPLIPIEPDRRPSDLITRSPEGLPRLDTRFSRYTPEASARAHVKHSQFAMFVGNCMH